MDALKISIGPKLESIFMGVGNKESTVIFFWTHRLLLLCACSDKYVHVFMLCRLLSHWQRSPMIQALIMG